MAEEAKKSFVLYFDNYRSIQLLSMSQRGELFSALFEYAMAVAEKNVEQEVILAKYPQMEPATQMAFRFLADSIHRDTVKWREKHERYRKAAYERHEKKRQQETCTWGIF